MRMRNIKPGFYQNEQLAECSPFARLVFPGLWMVADREGRLEYRPKRLKAEIMPYDNVNMVELIGELEANDLVKTYEVNGKQYLWIPTFTQHQKPHPNEKASEFPPCPLENISKSEVDNSNSDIGNSQNIETDCLENKSDSTNENLENNQGNSEDAPRYEASNTKDILNQALTYSSLSSYPRVLKPPYPPQAGEDLRSQENASSQADSPKKNQPPEKKQRKSHNATGNSLPELHAAMDTYSGDNETLRNSLEDFRLMRERIRKPMTGKA